MRAVHLSVLLLGATACGGTAAPERPDVLLISVDTLRADRLSCYGSERDTTPFLDALASEGVRFADAWAPSCMTAPSHMSLFTGQDPVAHGVRNVPAGSKRTRRLGESLPTLPEVLQGAGYRTVAFMDGGNLMPASGFDRGFEQLHSALENLRAKVGRVERFLASEDSTRPLFLFFHTYEVHAPYLPPKPYRGRYTDPEYEGEIAARYEALVGKPRGEVHTLARTFLRAFPGMGPKDVRYLSDLYDEGVAYTDSQLERLWRAWCEHRDGARTVAIVTSDHGEAFREHGALGHPADLHAELLRIPLLLRAPGLAPRVVEQPVSLTGVMATVCDLVGVETPSTQVPSLLPLARAGAGAPQPAFSQFMGGEETSLRESVVTEAWHRLRRAAAGEQALFALEQDPREQRDLASDRPDHRDALDALLDARLAQSRALAERHPTGWSDELTSEDIQALEHLGYTGGDED